MLIFTILSMIRINFIEGYSSNDQLLSPEASDEALLASLSLVSDIG